MRKQVVVMVAVLTLFANGCSLRNLAADRLGDALAGGGDVFASDDDPQLVGDALPFTLKLMESVLAERPRHRQLLLAAARGFTQYAYGWVAEPRQDERARRLYVRARNYGLRAFEVERPGFTQALRADPEAAVARLTRDDVPLLYWTASAWALAISLSKSDPEAVADLPIAGAMADRALALDESWGDGAIHSFLIAYEPNRPNGTGDGFARSRAHFERAVALSHGGAASPYVAFAEVVSVPAQNRSEFESMLRSALAVNVDARPEWRVENALAQRRAAWLLAHSGDLFLDAAQP
jgi:predicted anti-sigma-YlaC factor YlaD